MTPSGGEAHDEEETFGFLMLGLDTSSIDGNEEGSRLLIDILGMPAAVLRRNNHETTLQVPTLSSTGYSGYT